ncbi:hypothetical protein ACEZ3G_04070 [Maribacter algicola]|uniref:Uncharacterized protein n=1 Tax=Meishania litoralis TaxID=3434685 RepID=A0ACC7LGQ4_9FLAO
MKRITTILLATLFLVSCSDDLDDVINVELEGKWVLTDVLCYCGFGETPDFSGHKITFEGSSLMVENTGEFEFLNDAAGNYIVDGNLITLKNGDQYTYTIEGTSLKLTFVDEPGIADDEVLLVYVRS